MTAQDLILHDSATSVLDSIVCSVNRQNLGDLSLECRAVLAELGGKSTLDLMVPFQNGMSALIFL